MLSVLKPASVCNCSIRLKHAQTKQYTMYVYIRRQPISPAFVHDHAIDKIMIKR